jgi:hypothetical protein
MATVSRTIREGGTDALKAGLYGDVDNVNDSTIHEFRRYALFQNAALLDCNWEQLNLFIFSGHFEPQVTNHAKITK